jgi:hypothetical protein
MKNFGLFILLIGLICFTYYFEEVKGINQNIIKTDKQRLIKEFNQFDKLKTDQYIVEKKKQDMNEWIVGNLNYPASAQLLKDFSHILENINITGKVSSDNESDYFKQTKVSFTLFKGEQAFEYILGDVSSLTGKFYVKRLKDSKVYICQDDSRFSGPYKSGLDQRLRKYMRLKLILTGKNDLFIERKLFQHIDLNQVSKLKIDGKHNRWFEVDIKNGSTVPPKYAPLKYKKIPEVVQFLFDKAIVKNLLLGGQSILSNPVSEMKISHGNQISSAKLYAGLNGKYGRYVKFKNLNYIFELDETSAMIFNTHVQDFWNKKFLLDVDFSKMEDFQYQLSFDGDKYYHFEVKNLDKFDIAILNEEVSSINKNLMNFMFNLIFNLVDFKEAKYVEEITKINKSQLYLKIFKRDYALSILNEKIEVIDINSRIKYHFSYNTQQFKADTLLRIFTVKPK